MMGVTMTFRKISRRGRAVVGGALLVAASSAAHAVSTQVLGDFIETVNPVCDANKINCSVTFATVSANVGKLVLKASCELKLQDKDAKIWSASLGQKNGMTTSGPSSPLLPASVSASATFHFIQLHADTYHPFSSTQTPQIFFRITGGTFSGGSCSIAGVVKSTVS